MPDLDARMTCRCEEILEEEIRSAVREGYITLKAVKMRTRAGMGICQGNVCSSLIRRIISEMTGIPKEEVLEDTPRFPSTVIKLGSLADGAAE